MSTGINTSAARRFGTLVNAANVSQHAEPTTAFHEGIAFWVTASCPIRCQHCMFGALLERRDVPSRDDLCSWIDQAARTGRVKAISLTGGESFYDLAKLKAVVAHAAALGLRVTAVTNAFWASTAERAREVLGQVGDLTDLGISVDEFHLKHVPLYHVVNAASAAHELGLNVSLAMSYCRWADFNRLRRELDGLLPTPVALVPVQIVQQGNATRLDVERFDWQTHLPRGHCLGVNVPMVDKHGVVHACCEPPINVTLDHNPLILGDISREPIDAIQARVESDPYIQALRVLGPAYLAQLAIARGLKDRLSRCYPKDSKCAVCYDLLQDEEVQAAIRQELETPQVQQQIALRRAWFFGERPVNATMLSVTATPTAG